MRDSGAVQSSKGLDNHRQHRALLHLVRIPAWKKKITALYKLLKVLCIDEDWQLLECLLHCILLLDKGVEGLMGVNPHHCGHGWLLFMDVSHKTSALLATLASVREQIQQCTWHAWRAIQQESSRRCR